MKIRGSDLIEIFCKKHADATESLTTWVEIIKAAHWKNHNDLKADYPSADYVGNKRYVFNIKGNQYRLVLVVIFFAERVDIRFIGTHAEYNKIKNMKEI